MLRGVAVTDGFRRVKFRVASAPSIGPPATSLTPPAAPALGGHTAGGLARRVLYRCVAGSPRGAVPVAIGGTMWGRRKNKARKAASRLGACLDEGSEIEGTYTCS